MSTGMTGRWSTHGNTPTAPTDNCPALIVTGIACGGTCRQVNKSGCLIFQQAHDRKVFALSASLFTSRVNTHQMKKAFTGIFVLCAIVGSIIAAINFTTPLTLKKAPPPEKSAQVTEDKGEVIIDRIDVPQDIDQPAPSPGPEETAVSPVGENIPSKIVINPLTFHYKDAVPSPPETLLPQLKRQIIAGQRDLRATVTTSQKPADSGGGLLTDTGETEENQLLEPQSIQVTARNPQRGKK